MQVNFDYFNRAEDPTLFLYNPNNNILAFIPMYDKLVIKRTFNGLSEISLNIYKYVKDKNTGVLDLDRECECYKYIDVLRQIHVEDLGYFIISTCDENSDNINPYYEVTATSCEIGLNNAGLNIADSTYQFYNTSTPSNTILGKILNLCPTWKVGNVSNDVALRYRTFNGLNQNVYSFMSGDMGNAFECIADFDIENRIINILDSNTEIPDTDILLTFDNVIKNVKVSKSSDNIVTALSVSGSDGLEIRNANPLGTNVIYNFSYYKNTNWMTQGLIDAVNAWEQKIANSQTSYDNLIMQLITANVELSNLDAQLADLTTAWNSLKGVEASAPTSDWQTVHAATLAKEVEKNAKQIEVNNKQIQINNLNTQLSTLQSSLSITNNFTVSQYIELSPYIRQSDYKDENITVTNSMTYGQKQDQIKLLYNKGVKILEERAQPTLTITFDCNNFLFIKEFDIFRNQFNLGKKIHVEIEPEKIISMAVLQYELDYDSKDLKITVSNRLKLHDDFNKTKDLNAQVSATASTLTFGKDTYSYPMRSGILENLDAASKAAINLSKNEIVANAGQHAMFDTYGYHGFKIDPTTGAYSPKQIWIRNNSITMTTDNWATIKAAFGEFTLSNGTVVYGLNADTIVAGKIMSPTNPYVYFDLNNGIIAASKLVSSTTGATDVYANIGLVNWYGGDSSKGLGLYSSDGMICYLDQAEADYSGRHGLEIVSPGKIRLRCSGYGQDNSLVLFNDANEQGNIQMWRRSNDTTSEEIFNAYNGETDIYARNMVWLHTNTGTMGFRVNSSGFHFIAGGYEIALIDSQGYKGWINGNAGADGDITDKDGTTWHFKGGILVG